MSNESGISSGANRQTACSMWHYHQPYRRWCPGDESRNVVTMADAVVENWLSPQRGLQHGSYGGVDRILYGIRHASARGPRGSVDSRCADGKAMDAINHWWRLENANSYDECRLGTDHPQIWQ
jgi:hypothetical protein